MDFRRTACAPGHSSMHRPACLSIAHLYCPHHIGKRATIAALAQLVEHRIRNAGVVGSNPISGTSPTIVSFGFPSESASKHRPRQPTILCVISSQVAFEVKVA